LQTRHYTNVVDVVFSTVYARNKKYCDLFQKRVGATLLKQVAVFLIPAFNKRRQSG